MAYFRCVFHGLFCTTAGFGGQTDSDRSCDCVAIEWVLFVPMHHHLTLTAKVSNGEHSQAHGAKYDDFGIFHMSLLFELFLHSHQVQLKRSISAPIAAPFLLQRLQPAKPVLVHAGGLLNNENLAHKNNHRHWKPYQRVFKLLAVELFRGVADLGLEQGEQYE